MRYKFFNNSEKTWHAMYEAIRGAKESVYMEMYMYAEDMENYDFTGLLKVKAKEGLRIRIILDSLGSRGLRTRTLAGLKENGSELFFISHFIHRTHRKIIVVDEEVAFLGGVNFSKAASRWDDLAMEIRGKIVKYVVRSFAKAYSECGGRDPLVLKKNIKIVSDKTRSWLVEHFPLKKKFSLKKIYKEHVGDAKENVVLVTPYFTPKRWLVAALEQAVLRGVKVEVLMPKSTDIFIVDPINYFFIHKLSSLGVKFYLNPKMNHAKALIIDGREGMVGSQNLDYPSFELNDEIGLFLKDLSAVKKLSAITDDWKKESVLFELSAYKSSWIDYVVFPVIGFLSWFI